MSAGKVDIHHNPHPFLITMLYCVTFCQDTQRAYSLRVDHLDELEDLLVADIVRGIGYGSMSH